MIAAFLLALQAAPLATAPPAPPAATSTQPPQDWSALPILPMPKPTTALANVSSYVRSEVVAGRCARGVRAATGWTLTVDLAVLATPDGHIRRVTPRAIDCPTVEQYAAGIVIGASRATIDVPEADTDTWYRTSLTFAWGA